MKCARMFCLATLASTLCLAGSLRADSKLEVKNVHLCCPACVKAVTKLATSAGAKATCDQKAHTISLTAKDDATMQKALDALAAGGFHGDTGSKDLVMKDDSGATAGKVKTITIDGVHNCCASCTKSLKAAIKKVPGVTADTAKAKTTSFTVTGDFDAAELVKALNAAGFHGKVKK